MVRHFHDLAKRNPIHISLKDLGRDKVSRDTVRRALKLLESRGLIEVERQAGRLLTIKILEV